MEEKGAAEGNIVTIADKEGIWYMEILSGHQYVAILFPEDRYAVFPNTFFLGHVDFTNKERTIASKDVEKVARDAGSYKEIDGQFHVSQSYNPLCMRRTVLVFGLVLNHWIQMADVNYDDDYFDLMHTTGSEIDTTRCDESPTQSVGRNRLQTTRSNGIRWKRDPRKREV